MMATRVGRWVTAQLSDTQRTLAEGAPRRMKSPDAFRSSH
jgi:hypothetical protein